MEMYTQGGKIGIIDDEGSIFDVLSGIYSSGQANINIFLKAYDGSCIAFEVFQEYRDCSFSNIRLYFQGMRIKSGV